jgi:riboflavin kinase
VPGGRGSRSRRAPTPPASPAISRCAPEQRRSGVGVLRLHETVRWADRLVPLSMTKVEVHFLDRLRDEIKFPSIEALKTQIARDVAKAQKYFRRLV